MHFFNYVARYPLWKHRALYYQTITLLLYILKVIQKLNEIERLKMFSFKIFSIQFYCMRKILPCLVRKKKFFYYFFNYYYVSTSSFITCEENSKNWRLLGSWHRSTYSLKFVGPECVERPEKLWNKRQKSVFREEIGFGSLYLILRKYKLFQKYKTIHL